MEVNNQANVQSVPAQEVPPQEENQEQQLRRRNARAYVVNNFYSFNRKDHINYKIFEFVLLVSLVDGHGWCLSFEGLEHRTMDIQLLCRLRRFLVAGFAGRVPFGSWLIANTSSDLRE